MKAKGYTKETISQLGVVKRSFASFDVGDKIAVDQKVTEGDKERIQTFEGDVIAMHKNGISTTFTVRRIGAHGIAVERIFPYHSPFIEKITLVVKGNVRRARLYYLRNRVGRAARIEEEKTVHGRPLAASQMAPTELSVTESVQIGILPEKE